MKPTTKLKAVTTLFIVFSVSGCATVEKQKPETVFIPVTASRPALPERPHLAHTDIRKTSPADEIVKAYALSIQACVGYAEQLEEILKK